ncbi:CHAP domain-containing protein [Thermogemmatispora sp.]|uniref:CHAP domain-containing protein n=1 Tax=Thermogemmatispora sp. TaxID=1968838 RepID=UPI001D721780|nr:CHAP domain-containing protein [Thermogemmatispora sp.]MBX5450520.1 CHAP domain-containing protein [Thermogemmatispora sp.]
MRVHQRIWHYLQKRQQAEFLRKRRALAALVLLLSGTTASAAQAPLETQVDCLHLKPAVTRGAVQTCHVWGAAPAGVEAGKQQQRSQHLFPSKEPQPGEARTRRAPRPAHKPASARQPRRASQWTPAPIARQSQSVLAVPDASAEANQASPPPPPIATPVPPAPPVSTPEPITGPAGGSDQGSAGGNVFPYGQCTWWANQRYFQLHGIYVPWRTQADAWQWVARAYEFHWHVSRDPVPGAIIVLQPGVEGAYALGHVAVVEKVLGQGRVLASTMNWGATPWKVQYVVYSAGPGVAFIYSS